MTIIEEMQNAWNLGYQASLNLKPGDHFTGAFGAFAATTLDTRWRSIFTNGYLYALRRPVITTEDNIITQLGN